MHRVVVTGLGAVTPVGNSVPATWQAFLAGRSGIDRITRFDPDAFDVKIAGEVKNFSLGSVVNSKEARHLDLGTQYGLVATQEALADAAFTIDAENAEQVGIIFGSAGGGLGLLIRQQQVIQERGPGRVSPMFLPYFLADSTSGVLAMTFGASGPNMAVVSACATGGHAIGEAAETIRRGDVPVMIAGGAEAVIIPVIVAGFINMRALVKGNDNPGTASRPFDRDRAGFVLAEGAGAVILESLDHAQERGARIYAEVAGYGSSNDAYHMAAPREWGTGAVQCMRMALRKSGLAPAAVDYVNAHGTSTPLNDKYESAAIKDVFGHHAYELSVSSTKSMVGHMMGAAGAVESIACIKAIHESIVPPTINYQTPDPECDLDYTPNEPRRRPVQVAMTNSFGLGGHNSCVIFQKYEP